MNGKEYDFVVEGSSVAGARIARRLAESGYNIAVCDPSFGNPARYSSTREKACGGVINSELVEMLKIPETFKSRKARHEIRIIDARIKKYAFISPDEETMIEYAPTSRDVVVRRKNYDWYNLEPLLYMDNVTFYPYRINNIEEIDGKFVNTLETKKRDQVIGNYEIGAGGVWSRVRKLFFKPVEKSKFSKAIVQFLFYSSEKEVKERFDDTAYFYFMRDLGIGYAFVFPGYNYVRVGIGQKNVAGLNNEKLAQLCKKVYSHPILGEKLKGYTKKTRFLSQPVPFGGSKTYYNTHPTSKEKCAVLGDAAVKTHNMTFEGIFYATLDAELLWEHFSDKKTFKGFDEVWKSKYGDEIIPDKKRIASFYDKEELIKLMSYYKERLDEAGAEKFVLAFKGRYLTKPGRLEKIRQEVSAT